MEKMMDLIYKIKIPAHKILTEAYEEFELMVYRIWFDFGTVGILPLLASSTTNNFPKAISSRIELEYWNDS